MESQSNALSDVPVVPRGIPLEVAVFSPENAIKAESKGAHRVQLNRPGSSDVGGLTPGLDYVKQLHMPQNPLHKKLDIPVRIMIRPRGPPGPYDREPQDYIYSEAEFQQMKDSITAFKDLRTMNPFRGDAFVFGILKRVHPLPPLAESSKKKYAASSSTSQSSDGLSIASQTTGTSISSVASDSIPYYDSDDDSDDERQFVIDWNRCIELVRLALPIRCCFSRAFDAIAIQQFHWRDSMVALKEVGFTGVLTSGGPGTFLDNRENLLTMISRLPDIQLVVTDGITSYNVQRLLKRVRYLKEKNLWTNSPCFYIAPLSEGADPELVSMEEVDALRHAQGIADPEYYSPRPWRQIYH
ncbi:hypothetical protein B0T10DRAFT_593845 [Thelonectria olida]|uniref:Copper homeostasis protein cutC homolog n=1 Tax=Thelonectria olida TaxID=1576542 RepID=A0A9P8WA20_9HYPO|nr:hypothetical protein B0T10DRAFT_593845 [Thelonectria olida]